MRELHYTFISFGLVVGYNMLRNFLYNVLQMFVLDLLYKLLYSVSYACNNFTTNRSKRGV